MLKYIMKIKFNLSNRFVILIGAWFGIFLHSISATFSILSNNLAAERNWALPDTMWAYPLYFLVLSVVGIIAGCYVDKHEPKKLLLIGGPICGI